MEQRLTWNEYFMSIARLASGRSTCLRRQVGAVIVDNHNHIKATGYNGVPSRLQHCSERGCLRDQLKVSSGERIEICRALHAEQNAIIHAGALVEGCSIYVTHMPCITCAKMIVSAGICKIFYSEAYLDSFTLELLNEARIEILKI